MKIAFTGGGTAGHAMVNTVLIPYLQEKECHIIYIGSHNGMEKDMVKHLDSVKYYGISTGKWRRYLSFRNMTDIFRILKGYIEAYNILKAERPHVLYSGGGYVSVPVVFAAKRLHIPILIRETDYSVGLANRLCLPFAQVVFTAFPDTQATLTKNVSDYPGILIRPCLFKHTQFPTVATGSKKPLCLILGGSMGAKKINETVWGAIDKLSKNFDMIHICGKGNINLAIPNSESYKQFEFIQNQMGDFLKAANVVVTRCGSNTILETMAFGKSMVCIPITQKSSRGEQKQNAAFAVRHGNAMLLEEIYLNSDSLCIAIEKALELQKETPFKITQTQLEETIQQHISKIYSIGWKNMEDIFVRSTKQDIPIHFKELSDAEVMLYDEIVSNYVNYF